MLLESSIIYSREKQFLKKQHQITSQTYSELLKTIIFQKDN
jgi:hypothetical protein